MKESGTTVEEPPPPACHVDIQQGEGVTGVPDAADLVRWARAALEVEGEDSELCIRVVDETEIRELNRRYRDRDEVTNVLSFPCDLTDEAGVRLRGDVVICAQTLAREAAEQGKSLRAHWAHIVTHGTLHLLGYDHHDESESDEMERLEIELLAQFDIADPYRIVE